MILDHQQNPCLCPQFARSIELGYKSTLEGYLYASPIPQGRDATITKIANIPGSNLIYNIFQNAGNSHSQGLEVIVSNSIGSGTFNLNLNGYKNTIGAFSVVNKCPEEKILSRRKAGNPFREHLAYRAVSLCQAGGTSSLRRTWHTDAIPQGKSIVRFSIDAGVRKRVQRTKGELFVNVTDLANGLRLKNG